MTMGPQIRYNRGNAKNGIQKEAGSERMEKVMRFLWHLNAEQSCLYEAKTMTRSLLEEADGSGNALASLAPGSEEEQFAVGELKAAETSLRETEAALRELREKLLAILPKEGADER